MTVEVTKSFIDYIKTQPLMFEVFGQKQLFFHLSTDVVRYVNFANLTQRPNMLP